MHGTQNFKVRKVYFKEHVLYVHFGVKVKLRQSLYRPGQGIPRNWGSQMSRQAAHEGGKVSRTHRPPLPIPLQEIFLGLISIKQLSRPYGQSAAGRIMSMKNSSDTIGNWTRELPAWSAASQSTVVHFVAVFWLYSTWRPLALWRKNNCVSYLAVNGRPFAIIVVLSKSSLRLACVSPQIFLFLPQWPYVGLLKWGVHCILPDLSVSCSLSCTI
jgi:hypothetical protein